MSDATDQIYRCTCCNGALVRAPVDDVPVLSAGSLGIDTEERELVCDECWVRLAREHERLMSTQGPVRRSS